MGFLKKMQGSYPATQNRISQQHPHALNNCPQQSAQGNRPPNRVHQSNVIPVASVQNASFPAATAYAAPATVAQPATATAQPVTAAAYVPGQTPVVAQAFVPQQTPNAPYASAPTVDSFPPSYNPAISASATTSAASANHSTAQQQYSSGTESKFWECSTCTFPNLRSELQCKGCGSRIPEGMYRPNGGGSQYTSGHATTATAAPAPAQVRPAQVHVAQQHVSPTAHTTNLSHQMNQMNLSPKPSTMRVPIPQGMQPGQKIKVRSPEGKEVVKAIPPRNEWNRDEYGNNFFRMTFGSNVIAGTAVSPASTSHAMGSTSAPSPYTTTWRSFHPRASSAYSPPPIGMRSVPHTPLHSSPIVPNGRHKSLLIGINYTGTRAALKGCHNDALSMQRLLRQNGFPDDGSHMLLLMDDRSKGSEYQPTASNIMKAFAWFMKDVQKGDVLFFHFSGHGGQVPDKTGMEADGYNETLVPLDYQRAGQISDDVLFGSLVYPLPEGVRLTALMDMCHSGTGLDLPYDYNVDTRRWREDVNPAHSRGDAVLFSGCEDAQTSADVQGGARAGGAMTMAFTKAYEECGRMMATYHDFLVQVKRELRRKGMRQRPQLTSSQKFDANNRIFSFGHMSGGGAGVPTTIEANHNPMVGRKKNRHVRAARPGFGGGGGNDLFAMAAAGAGAMLFANALGNIFDA